jgi:hypothetical protein
MKAVIPRALVAAQAARVTEESRFGFYPCDLGKSAAKK